MNKLAFVRAEVQAIPGAKNKPPRGDALKYFGRSVASAIRLIRAEPEIIIFALLQWLAVTVGFYLWVQIFTLIPDEVWQRAAEDESTIGADIVLTLWSLFIVILVALPLGLLTACMGAAHVLHRQGQKSTMAACFTLAAPRAWPMWVFTSIDGWMTVSRIVDRLPKRGGRGSAVGRAFREALYYAWKLGTVGVVPALLTGRGLVDAAKDSVRLVRHRLADTSMLRLGYSLVCWIVAIVGYIGSIFFVTAFADVIPSGQGEGAMYTQFFVMTGVPIAMITGIVLVFIRPIFILAATDLYCDELEAREEPLVLPRPSVAVSRIVVVGVLLFIAAVGVLVFAEPLGLTGFIAR